MGQPNDESVALMLSDHRINIRECDCGTLKNAIVQMHEIDLCMYHKTRFLHFLKEMVWCLSVQKFW